MRARLPGLTWGGGARSQPPCLSSDRCRRQRPLLFTLLLFLVLLFLLHLLFIFLLFFLSSSISYSSSSSFSFSSTSVSSNSYFPLLFNSLVTLSYISFSFCVYFLFDSFDIPPPFLLQLLCPLLPLLYLILLFLLSSYLLFSPFFPFGLFIRKKPLHNFFFTTVQEVLRNSLLWHFSNSFLFCFLFFFLFVSYRRECPRVVSCPSLALGGGGGGGGGVADV